MSDAEEPMLAQQEEIKAEASVQNPDRHALGMACVVLATLVLLILLLGTLLLLPAALDNVCEAWRGPLLLLGIQTTITILPWYFAGMRLIRHNNSRPPGVLRIFILLNIPLQVVFLVICIPPDIGISGNYEFIHFVSLAMVVQGVLAVGMALLLHVMWLQQPAR